MYDCGLIAQLPVSLKKKQNYKMLLIVFLSSCNNSMTHIFFHLASDGVLPT